jgi:hypothetical protein
MQVHVFIGRESNHPGFITPLNPACEHAIVLRQYRQSSSRSRDGASISSSYPGSTARKNARDDELPVRPQQRIDAVLKGGVKISVFETFNAVE